jgi:hypothetical protein
MKSASWFSRSSRRKSEDDIKPGNRYRRQLGSRLAATATVLDLRPDLQGIPHVHFAIAVGGSCGGQAKGDTRVLALQSFLDTYRERLEQESRPDPESTCDNDSIFARPHQRPLSACQLWVLAASRYDGD